MSRIHRALHQASVRESSQTVGAPPAIQSTASVGPARYRRSTPGQCFRIASSRGKRSRQRQEIGRSERAAGDLGQAEDASHRQRFSPPSQNRNSAAYQSIAILPIITAPRGRRERPGGEMAKQVGAGDSDGSSSGSIACLHLCKSITGFEGKQFVGQLCVASSSSGMRMAFFSRKLVPHTSVGLNSAGMAPDSGAQRTGVEIGGFGVAAGIVILRQFHLPG